MANWFSDNSETKFRVTVSKYYLNKHFTDYEILIQFPSNINWKVRKRYSEFLKLYDELAGLDSNFRVYFPPKEMFKSKSEYFLTQRKRSLEMYMNEIISVTNNYLPRPLAKFLEMEKYEIHGITTHLAKLLFKHGDSLLSSKRMFEISVLSIYAINQRMISPAPTNIYNRSSEDFGNVLEVLESTKKIKIVPYNVLIHGSDSLYGTSNIKSESLPFDISIFNGAESLELNSIEITNLRGLYKMNAVIETLEAHYCLKSLEDILFGDLVHRSSNIEDLRNFHGPWKFIKTADFSNNSITHIDKSIVTLKQVSNLNLSYNQISEIDNLHYLTFLTELDLSNNCLYMSENFSFSNKLGSLKKLVLKGNKLSKLNVIDRMFSLEYLDVSDNNIREFKGLLSLCRLSCLENLIIKRNPICSSECFPVVIFDIFLDQMDIIRINGISYEELSPQLKQEISYRRQLKESLMFDFSNLQTQFECSGEMSLSKDDRNLLMSIDIDMENISKKESILYIPELYNILIYWYFTAVKRSVLPSKILWCTEIFPPNLCMRPVPVLVISCNTLSASILQCSLKFSSHNSGSVLTIQPHRFYDLNKSLKNLVIGADKMFIRFDMITDNRYLYLINNSHFVDSFMGHLYHVDDEIVKFGDSRLIFLNEDDRMESLRRFIDVWRIDLVGNLLRSGDQRHLNTNTESEILFCSRAMLKMQNGFHLLLTIVVTRQMLCLVDERIYDWPDLVRRTSCSDFSTIGHYSPQTSSSSQFQFLRINAYFFHQIKSCIQQPVPVENILGTWTPTFSHSLQITFNPISSNLKEPIRLHFETVQKSENACQIINQLCENEESPTVISSSVPVFHKHVPQEIPSYLKHLSSSFQEIRLNLSLFCPKLSTVALSTLDEIVSFCHSKIHIPESSKIFGILWTKFIYYKFDSNDDSGLNEERSCLLCLSSNHIHIIYETEEPVLLESECWSDPESDQPDGNSNPTKLNVISMDFNEIFKIFIGLYHQWITLCCRHGELESENRRLILIMRNTDQSKQLVNWIKSSVKDQSSQDESLLERFEYAHDDGNIDELLFQIRKMARCEDIDLIHYTCIEDARIDLPSISSSTSNDSREKFTFAVVITSSNISIIRHNIVEYPVRQFGVGAVRQSPFHMQYQMIRVVPLYECVQIQLPGHDKNLLIIIVQSHCQQNNSSGSTSSTYKIQLSVACQKEQKHLIDKLRQQWTKCLQTDVPLRVNVC